MNDNGRGGGNDGDWRRFAIGTMTLFFTALFIFAALADRFLSRFMPVFIALMLVALVLYTLVVGSIRLIQRAKRHHDTTTPTTPSSPTPTEPEARS